MTRTLRVRAQWHSDSESRCGPPLAFKLAKCEGPGAASGSLPQGRVTVTPRASALESTPGLGRRAGSSDTKLRLAARARSTGQIPDDREAGTAMGAVLEPWRAHGQSARVSGPGAPDDE